MWRCNDEQLAESPSTGTDVSYCFFNNGEGRCIFHLTAGQKLLKASPQSSYCITVQPQSLSAALPGRRCFTCSKNCFARWRTDIYICPQAHAQYNSARSGLLVLLLSVSAVQIQLQQPFFDLQCSNWAQRSCISFSECSMKKNLNKVR